ncbi:DUF5686 and carboxypeptidase regulatory-like domain-containing protein [Rhodoflexus caldus]|uniref:DUF5686 and carboxypeptidase regulatory-like domain-containing protein n=1 Tax=Rhodoflexus caldus TaxID=2891236 RepID=UPI00202A9C97|nr:DUF5686 and carboxypeptidase regulatory-like domain-containing protein [Rhodoflexus caldus]
MKNLLLPILSCLLVFTVQAQKVRGRVTDEQNQPMPYLTVFEEGTSNGTTTNAEGEYFLEIASGKRRIVFRYLGYQTETREIDISKGQTLTLDVQMKPQPVVLKEVQVSSKDEDPAYAIIRAAQRNRKFYLNQVDRFECQVYIKGLQRILNAPKKILGQDVILPGLDKNRSGIIYLSESLSRYYFEAPNKQKEVMLSSKVSGNNRGFSWNSAMAFKFNFYENSMESFAERNFISPIAATSFVHYRFQYIGEYKDKGLTINKIKVIPRAKGAPLFSGYIYIQDSTWRIHSTDLYITKDAGVDFVDTVRIRQQYIPVSDQVWMLGSQVIDGSGGIEILGIKLKFAGSYTGVFSSYVLPSKYYTSTASVVQEKQTPALAKTAPARKARSRQPVATAKTMEKPPVNKSDSTSVAQSVSDKLDQPYDKNFFKGELIRVEKEANMADTNYWAQVRPIPLTDEERTDYVLKDSIRQVVESVPYKDSVDEIRNKFKPINILTGYRYNKSSKRVNFDISAPINGIQFNTVEGWALDLNLQMNRYDSARTRNTSVYSNLHYGFTLQRPYGGLGVSHRFNAINRLYILAEAGNKAVQFNPDAIPFTHNTSYTLWTEQNFMKLYEKAYAIVQSGMQVARGLNLLASVQWERRSPLTNAEALPTFWRRDIADREYTGNDPQNPLNNSPAFEAHQALVLGFRMRYQPGSQYRSFPNRRVFLGSKWPVFTLAYRKGMADVDYDYVRFSVEDELNLGMLGSTEYDFSVGTFLNANRLQFMDFKHFNTTQTIFNPSALRSFRALPYYQYSTLGTFFEGHAEHHFNGFLFNKIPLLKKLRWQEVAGLHILYTEQLKQYAELTLGIEKIFKILRVDYVMAFQRDQPIANAFRLGIGF